MPSLSRRKWLASVLIALVSARMLDLTHGSFTPPPMASSSSSSADGDATEGPVNGDFLALSDTFTGGSSESANNFYVPRFELDSICPNGQCGGGDVLRVVSQLAKRILSDPRILGLRTVPHPNLIRSGEKRNGHRPVTNRTEGFDGEAARAIGANSFDTRPFSNSDFYGDDFSASSNRYNYRTKDRYAEDNDMADSSYMSESAADRDGGYGGGYDSGYDSGGGYDSYGGGGGYGGGGYGGGYQSCCEGNNKLLPIFLIGLLGLLAFYLYIRSTTTTAGRRKRGAYTPLEDNDISDVLLDGPTWLSMVHELWEQDQALDNLSCAQETLCRMNRLAMAAPGQAGWAVSLSSLPLSYLLHSRHNGEGFTSYMDAALMGRSGVNCTELYSSCPRLH